MRADILLTNDLVLKPLSASDETAFNDLRAGSGQPASPHDFEFQRLLESTEMPVLLLKSNTGQELIGYLDWTDPKQPFVQIAPDYRLRGYASQAFDRVSRFRDDLPDLHIPLDPDNLPARLLLEKCGYQPVADSPASKPQYTIIRGEQRQLTLDLLDSEYRQASEDRVRIIHQSLDIDPDYGRLHQLEPAVCATTLSSIGNDIYGREQYLTPSAAGSWQALIQAATKAGESLQAVSAYRSVSYQESIMRRKLDAGGEMTEILKVSAAPGYSEHHTGCAIDINTPGCATLEEEFENTSAFAWLTSNASHFGFLMSYPRNNKHQIAYEPWHWAFDANKNSNP